MLLKKDKHRENSTPYGDSEERWIEPEKRGVLSIFTHFNMVEKSIGAASLLLITHLQEHSSSFTSTWGNLWKEHPRRGTQRVCQVSQTTYVFAQLISEPVQDTETGFCKQGRTLNNSQMASEVASDPRRSSLQLRPATVYPQRCWREAKDCFEQLH